jgi:hypothetical protein
MNNPDCVCLPVTIRLVPVPGSKFNRKNRHPAQIEATLWWKSYERRSLWMG